MQDVSRSSGQVGNKFTLIQYWGTMEDIIGYGDLSLIFKAAAKLNRPHLSLCGRYLMNKL